MKKHLALFFALFATTCYAQNTAITATVVDSDGTAWSGGTWTMSLVPGPSNSNPMSYTVDGGPVSSAIINQTGTLNGSGVATMSVYTTSHLAPAGSKWLFNVCPKASSSCSQYTFIAVGTTQDISSALTAVITAPRFPAVSGSYGYADIEAQTPLKPGSTYYNVISNTTRISDGTIWNNNSGLPNGSAQWVRQPVPMISPFMSDPSPQVQESSAVLSTSPEILTGYNSVVKMTFTSGWWYTGGGGTGIGICFGESPDGISNLVRHPICPIAATVNYARSWLMNNPVGGGYILYATNVGTGQVAQFTGSTVAGLTLAHSNILSCGGNGNESAGTAGNTSVIYNGGVWTMFYDCVNSTGSSSYAIWRATSSDGFTWTKASTTPVLGFGSGVTMGGSCSNASGSWSTFSGGVLHAYLHCGPVGSVPTPYIWHVKDTTAVGNTFIADSGPAITARTGNEGVNLTVGQIADAFLLDMGTLNESLLYFTEYKSGCSAQPTCAFPSYIEVAQINQPLATILNQSQSDYPVAQNVPSILINGRSISSNSQFNLIGNFLDTGYGQITPTIATDLFMRAVGALGSNWTTSANLTITQKGQVGNLSSAATADVGYYTGTGTTFPNDQCSNITIVTPPPSTSDWVGLTVRETASQGYGLLAFPQGGASKYYIYKFSVTIFGSVLVGPINTGSAMAAGDQLKLCAIGSTISASKNGVALAGVTVSDATFGTGGSPGIALNSTNSGARITSFAGTTN